MIPILKLPDGFVIRESLIISQFLLDTFSPPNCVETVLHNESSLLDKVKIGIYSSYASDFMAPRCRNYTANFDTDLDPALLHLLQGSLDFLDACLQDCSEGPFLMGKFMTLVIWRFLFLLANFIV